jgi:hypothetical protein
MKPLRWFFRFALECHHDQLSRVFTIEKRTYQVCLECGKECEYSWGLMHSSSPALPVVPMHREAPSDIGSQR